MAFTESEKYRIIRYLGWPANTLVPTSLSYSKIVSDRLLNVADPAIEEVREMLDRIKALDASRTAAVDSSGVKAIDDIQFFGKGDGTKLEELLQERKRLIKELSQILDLVSYDGGSSMGNVCI